MPRIMVYAFALADDSTETGAGQRRIKASREVIAQLPGATIIESSAEEVDLWQLDARGYYHPPG
jgi:hypothetical protein